MGILEAIKRGFSQTGKLMSIVLIFFVFNVIVGLISLPLTNPERASNPGIVAVTLLFSLIFFLVFIFLQGGALGLVKDRIKTQSMNLSQFPVYGKAFYKRILCLLLLYILIAVAVVLLLSLVSAGLLLIMDNVIMRSILATIITVVAISIVTLLIYPIYVIVVDDLGPIAALKKGIMTAKNNFWKTLGLFICLLLISLIISLIIGVIVGLVTVPLPVGATQVIISIINAAVQSYIPIVMMVAFMNFYIGLSGASSAPQAPEQPTI